MPQSPAVNRSDAEAVAAFTAMLAAYSLGYFDRATLHQKNLRRLGWVVSPRTLRPTRGSHSESAAEPSGPAGRKGA
jgi:hypothetical protein